MSRQNKVLSIISRSNPENDFELLKQIGSGTYGDVYKVRNTLNTVCTVCTVCAMCTVCTVCTVCIACTVWSRD